MRRRRGVFSTCWALLSVDPEIASRLSGPELGRARFGRILLVFSMFFAAWGTGFHILGPIAGTAGPVAGVVGTVFGAFVGGGASFLVAFGPRLIGDALEAEEGCFALMLGTAVSFVIVFSAVGLLVASWLDADRALLDRAEQMDAQIMTRASTLAGSADLAEQLRLAREAAEDAQADYEVALGYVETVATAAGRQIGGCTRDPGVIAVQTALAIRPLDGCAREITSDAANAHAEEMRAARDAAAAELRRLTELKNAADRRLACIDENGVSTIGSDTCVVSAATGAQNAAQVFAFTKTLRWFARLWFKLGGVVTGERDPRQDDPVLVAQLADNLAAGIAFFVSGALDVLSVAYNSGRAARRATPPAPILQLAQQPPPPGHPPDRAYYAAPELEPRPAQSSGRVEELLERFVDTATATMDAQADAYERALAVTERPLATPAPPVPPARPATSGFEALARLRAKNDRASRG